MKKVGPSCDFHFLIWYFFAVAPVCRKPGLVAVGAAREESLVIPCEVDADPPARSFKWKFNNSGETQDVMAQRYTSNGSVSILTSVLRFYDMLKVSRRKVSVAHRLFFAGTLRRWISTMVLYRVLLITMSDIRQYRACFSWLLQVNMMLFKYKITYYIMQDKVYFQHIYSTHVNIIINLFEKSRLIT